MDDALVAAIEHELHEHHCSYSTAAVAVVRDCQVCRFRAIAMARNLAAGWVITKRDEPSDFDRLVKLMMEVAADDDE